MKRLGKAADGGSEPPRRRGWGAPPPNAEQPSAPPAGRPARNPVLPNGGQGSREADTAPSKKAPPSVAPVVHTADEAAKPSLVPSRAAKNKLREPAQPSSFRPPPASAAHPPLISRGERILFWSLLLSVVAMSVFLVRYRERVDAHFEARASAVPLAGASANSSGGPLLLSLANDSTGALSERSLSYPVPEDPGTRARVVLEKLLSEYTAPGSLHPLKTLPPGAEPVHQVFLAPVPGRRGTLAVVDLSSGFAHLHPSGIEPETLTLLSMIATLHANLPSVTQVRFLVDGEPRPTLAGHADLGRTYLAGAAPMTPGEAFTTGASLK